MLDVTNIIENLYFSTHSYTCQEASNGRGREGEGKGNGKGNGNGKVLLVWYIAILAKKQALEAATRKHSARQGVEAIECARALAGVSWGREGGKMSILI